MELDPRSPCGGNGWYRPVHHWASWGLPCALMNSHEGQKGWAPFCCWMQLVDRTKGDEKSKKANTRRHTGGRRSIPGAARPGPAPALPLSTRLPTPAVPPPPRPHESRGGTLPSAP